MKTRPPGPAVQDWVLLAIGVTFVAIGLLMLRDKPREALMPLTFFGVCTLVFAYNIVRKRRRQRFSAIAVSVRGGVKLHGSNSRMLLLAALIGIPAVPIFVIETPLLLKACGAVMLAASAWLVFAVSTGRISKRFMRFDPPGLTMGNARAELFIPWDEIVNVVEFELHDNASVGFDVADFNKIVVTPSTAGPGELRAMTKNQAYSGRHVVIMALHFNVPAESLCAALVNYSRDPAARAELVARPALNQHAN